MTDEELIARLRDEHVAASRTEAADRIEALVKERDILVDRHERNLIVGAETRARAERLKAVLRIIAGNNCITCSADAFNALFAERHPSAALKGEDHPPAPRRYMGQIMAECDCPREAECQAAGRCIAEELGG